MRMPEAITKIWKEGGMYVSYCMELDIASGGHTPEEARKNLAEVIAIQKEERTTSADSQHRISRSQI